MKLYFNLKLKMDRHDTHLLSCSSSVEHSYKFDKSGNIISDSVSDMVAFSKASNKKKYKISDIFENLNKDNNNIIQEEDISNINNNKNDKKEITINKNNYKVKEINISNSNITKDKDKKLINTNKNKFIINKDEKNKDKKLENNCNLDEEKKIDGDIMEKENNINGNKNILCNKDNNMTISQIIKDDQKEKQNAKDDNKKDINKDKDKGKIENNKNNIESIKNINNNGNNYKVIQSNETFMYSPYEKGNLKYKIKSNEIKEEKEKDKEIFKNNNFNHNIIKKEAEYTYSLNKYDDKILKEINVIFITLKSTKSKIKYFIEKDKDNDSQKHKDEVNDNNKKEINNLTKENLEEYNYDAKYMERMKFSSRTNAFLSPINNMVKEKEMIIEKTVIEKYLMLPMNDFCYMGKSPMIINYKKSLSNVKNNFYFVSKEVLSMDKYKKKIMNINCDNVVNNKKIKESIMFDQFNNKGDLNKVIKNKFKLNNNNNNNNNKEDGNNFVIDETEENFINNKNNISTQNNDYDGLGKNLKEKMSIIRKKDNNEYNKDADDLSFINKNLKNKNKNKINLKDNENDDDDNVSKEKNNLLNNNKINNLDKGNLIGNNNVDKGDNLCNRNLDRNNNLRNKNKLDNNRFLNNNFENTDNNNEDKLDEYSEVKNILEKYQNENNANIKNNDICNLNNNQTQINNIKKKNLLSPKKIIQKSNNNILKPISSIKNNLQKVPNSAYLTPLTKNKNSNTNYKYKNNNINDTTNKINRIISPLTINNNHIRERRLFNDSNLPNVKKLKFEEKKNRNRSLINIINHKGIEDDYSLSHKKENSPQNYCIHLEEELNTNSKKKYKRHFRNEKNCPICVALQLKNKLLEEKARMLPALTKTNFRKVCDHEHGNKSPNKEIMKTIYPRNKEKSLIRVGSGTNVLTTRKKDKRRNESVKQIRRIEISNKLLNEQDNNSKEKFPVIKDYFNINNL